VGYVDTDTDPLDKRRNLVILLKNGENIPISSTGIFESLFSYTDLENWLNSAIKYSSGKVTLYNNELKNEITKNDLFTTYYPADYSKTPETPLEPKRKA
jgi:hypothetical protein